jgi:Ca2+-binding RTX toxin-like protein
MTRNSLLAAAGLAAIAATIAAPIATAAPAVRARVIYGTLEVTGTPFADRITLRVNPANANQLQVDVNDDGMADATFDLASFSAIDIRGRQGNDTIKLDTAAGAFTTAKPTTVHGGRGNDTLIGGSGNETFYGGRDNDTIDGNGGADTAFLGRGDDTFTWDPGDGSDVVEGGSGYDTHIFNGAGGAEDFAATANGHRVTFTRNLGNIVMDLNDIEALRVNALGGEDQVVVNDLSGTGMTRVDVDFAGALGGTTADGAADTVQVIGTAGNDTIHASAKAGVVTVSGLAATVRVSHADADKDKLAIDALGGSNIELVDAAVDALIGVSLE